MRAEGPIGKGCGQIGHGDIVEHGLGPKAVLDHIRHADQGKALRTDKGPGVLGQQRPQQCLRRQSGQPHQVDSRLGGRLLFKDAARSDRFGRARVQGRSGAVLRHHIQRLAGGIGRHQMRRPFVIGQDDDTVTAQMFQG